MKRGGQFLTRCDLSLLVIGTSCDQDGGMSSLQIIILALLSEKIINMLDGPSKHVEEGPE